MNFSHKSFHAISYNGSYYLFDIEKLLICDISYRTYSALINEDSSIMDEEEEKNLICLKNKKFSLMILQAKNTCFHLTTVSASL